MRRRPTFENVEVFFAGAADEVMSAALQEERTVFVERKGGVRAVAFFFDDDKFIGDFGKANLRQIFVARLETRAF